MVENWKKHRQNSNLIIHCPTSERTSEWPSACSLYSWLFSTIVHQLSSIAAELTEGPTDGQKRLFHFDNDIKNYPQAPKVE